VFLGVFAWEFMVWPTTTDHTISVATRLIATAYPLGDLMIIALMLRLMFAGGARHPSLALMFAPLCCFLVADTAWAAFMRSGTMPNALQHHLIEMTSLCAFALT